MEQFRRDQLVFDVRDEGPAEGEGVVLLHGFPEDSSSWHAVVPPLHAAGLRTLAPDLRGYSPGARPTGRAAYRLDVMVGDVLALLDAAGLDRAHVVGHDWGGGLAWATAIAAPERVSRLTVLSTPHPLAMAWAWRHDTQALRSWYMLAFQVPAAPELLLRAGIRRGGLNRLDLPPERVAAYAERLLEPGALTGAVNWYRALSTRPAPGAPSVVGPVDVPTTYLWGRRDAYLGAAAARRTARYCRGPYRAVELDADHWLPEKAAGEVARAILDPVEGAGQSAPDR